MCFEREAALALVASVSGIYGARNHSAYGVAKAGVNSLVRTMANEWSPGGIRINSVVPDVIATPRVLASFHQHGGTEIDSTADGVPMAGYGTPEEIAGPLVFLLSDLSSFMTGQCLIVDGGTGVNFPHRGGRIPNRT